LTVLLDGVFSERPTLDWLRRLNGKVPVAPVNDVAQALDNPYVAERGSIQDFRYPDERAARLVANPIRLSDAELPKRAGPALGADTDALLAELGYAKERILELRSLKVVA
jgi:succinate---hydroxymethylglutarate CoA-transferase